MLDLKIKAAVLSEGSVVRFQGAVLELLRYAGQEIQVNTYIYLEQEGLRYQFITRSHCDLEKNRSIEKHIVCEAVKAYTFPEETRENQVIYYAPGKNTPVAVSKLSRRKNLDYFDGAFQGETILGCEYFAFLRETGENDYMVLLSTKNLRMLLREAFMQQFCIEYSVQKNTALFHHIFSPGREIIPRGAYLGIVKISDIYATETKTFFEQEGHLYEYSCLEKFDECREDVIRNTRFYRSCDVREVETFSLPPETEFAMMDCYLPVDEKKHVLRQMTAANYGKYVPFDERDVTVSGCTYFAAVLRNRADKMSENVLYSIVESYKKTRFKKLRNSL